MESNQIETDSTLKSNERDDNKIQDGNKLSKKFEVWRNRLQDLTGRNKLLNFRLSRSSSLEIINKKPTEIFREIVENGITYEISIPTKKEIEEAKEENGEEYDEFDVGELKFSQDIKRLYRIFYNLRARDREFREERGINTLYLAFPFLQWYEADNRESIQSPIFLFPLELKAIPGQQKFSLSLADEDIVLNQSLEVRLENDFNFKFPQYSGDLDLKQYNQFNNELQEKLDIFPRWAINDKIVISSFNFQNLMIIADLFRNEEAFSENDLVRDIGLGLDFNSDNIEIIERKELDTKVPIQSTFQVMDADSSQQEAIVAVKNGSNLIIQGPPGTGKSQTITNIIAEFLSEGKSILFVSQKIAALQVVRDRLNQANLGDFCLEVHSHRQDKKGVIYELGKALNSRINSKNRKHAGYQNLENTRSKINEFVKELHEKKFSIKMSPFELYGMASKLRDVYDLRFKIPTIDKITLEEISNSIEIIVEFYAYEAILKDLRNYYWFGLKAKRLSLDEKENLEERYKKFIGIILQSFSLVSDLSIEFRLDLPKTIRDLSLFLRVFRNFHPKVLNPKYYSLLDEIVSKYNNFTRYLRPGYYKLRKELESIFINNVPNYKDLCEDYSFLVELIGETPDNQEISRDFLIDEIDDISDCSNQLIHLFLEIESLKKLYEEVPVELDEFLGQKINPIMKYFEEGINNIQNLDQWVGYCDLVDRSSKTIIFDFVNQILGTGIPVDQWENIFLKRMYLLLIDKIESDTRILRDFEGVTHSNNINEFVKLDIERIRLAQDEIIQKQFDMRPDSSWIKGNSSQEAILRRELNKKRRHKPLRTLFSEIPELITTLKPCIMMSPFTVSQLLDPIHYKFDLVIFDEASQIPTEYSIGAISRGKQVVIAGDKQQLPPTNFFQSYSSENDDEDEIYDEFESLLHESDGIGFPSKMLEWHYRSKNESLIAFSNHHFYHDKLFTFPSPDWSIDSTAIEFIYVEDGIYKRGGGGRYNQNEAVRVVEEVIKHYQKFGREKSLGVVTFNYSQKQVIEEYLREKVNNEFPELAYILSAAGDEPFFVKNLEMVQGDERDYIFFSITFGYDEAGKFLLNFGPLNKQNGERRLNVAISRAKFGVKVISSINPEDIDLSRTSPKGAKLLREYLALARDGLSALYESLSYSEEIIFDSPFEEEVYQALSDEGLILKTQVGVSGYRIDFGVVNPDLPGQFLFGIECDGAMYHSAATARDRDRIRQSVLESLGWKLYRIWSKDWFRNPKAEIRKVVDYYNKILNKEIKEKDDSLIPEVSSLEIVHFEESENGIGLDINNLPKGIKPYKKFEHKLYNYGSEAFVDFSDYSLKEIAVNLIVIEGPIHKDLIFERIKEIWRIPRSGSRINRKLNGLLRYLITDTRIIQENNFYSIKNSLAEYSRCENANGYKRGIDQIPDSEIDNALKVCLRDAGSLEREELIRNSALIFGHRSNQKVKDIIEPRIDSFIEKGVFKIREGGIVLETK